MSVLTDQVEAQGEKIRDLEVCLEGHQVKLNAAEEMLQQVRRRGRGGRGRMRVRKPQVLKPLLWESLSVSRSPRSLLTSPSCLEVGWAAPCAVFIQQVKPARN